MSRSVQKSTSTKEEKTPARREEKCPTRSKVGVPSISNAITTINDLIGSFVDSATEIQIRISAEIQTLSKQGSNILHLIADKDEFERLCSRVSQINHDHNNSQKIMKAESEWRQLIRDHPISFLVTSDTQMRRIVCTAGRRIAASLLITGNIYRGLCVLKEVVEISEYDPPTAIVLLRWLVRSGEFEALEEFLKCAQERGVEKNVEGFEDLIQLCRDILDFHRYPALRAQNAVRMMKLCDELNNTKEKTLSGYETQILLYSTLSLASKVAGIKTKNMMDPLFCIDRALDRAETVLKNRWTSFGVDKQLDGLKAKSGNSLEYLKTAAAVAEYFHLLRLTVNEYVRCAILREPAQFASIGLCHAIKLGFPMWTTETSSLLLSTRLRSEAEGENLAIVKGWINALFIRENDEKENDDDSSKKSMRSSSDESLHIPSISSSCDCHLCIDSSTNPEFAFFCSKLSLLCSGHSIDSINSFVSNYERVRSAIAPLQQKLMNTMDGKPRPPSWICDEMGQSMVSFLLSSTGLSLRRNDSNRIRLITLARKICSYSSQLCLPYSLVLRHLNRHPREQPSFPWMSRTSISAKMESLSLGSEDPASPVAPHSLTPNRPKGEISEREKEDEEEKNDYAIYGHLLYHDWRSRVCEQMCLSSSDPWTKAMALSECVAVATREARRLTHGHIEPFGFRHVEDFKRTVEKMPSDITAIELIVTMSGDVYLIKINSAAAPIVVPLARESKWSIIMDGFAKAREKNEETAILKDPKTYWEGRRKAEEMMRRAMVDMESDLLGPFAPLLLPTRNLTETGISVYRRVRKEGGITSHLAKEMVAIAAQTTATQFKQLVQCMGVLERWSTLQVKTLLALQKKIDKGESREWIEPITELPFVFFVLSTELSHSPWEAVSILSGKALCSRLTSIHQLFLFNANNKIPHTANPLSSFYILDPENNLAQTQNRLTPLVKSWKGVTGQTPDKNQVESIISENDFFMYLGHGDGLRYLSRSTIRKTRCNAVVLLMGCSSVRTVHDGRGMDGSGAVVDYSVASCPCIVGCIYMVTDGEIDRYFTALVNEGLARHLKEGDASSELRLHLEAMAKARTRVKLPYLTGANVVSYGIPVDIRVKHNA